MEPTDLQRTRSIHVTGLAEDAIRAVESLVALLRKEAGEQHRVAHCPFSSRDEWIRVVRDWAASHKTDAASADWSRESIYAGRGE